MTLYKICIDNLKLDAWVGIHPHEQCFQLIIFEIEIELKGKLSNAYDDINHALNYEAVVSSIKELCKNNKYQLLETLANATCELILNFPLVTQVWLKVGKPNILSAEQVSIKLHRSANTSLG